MTVFYGNIIKKKVLHLCRREEIRYVIIRKYMHKGLCCGCFVSSTAFRMFGRLL